MNTPPETTPDRIVFISDAHLGMPGDDPDRQEILAGFLRRLRGRATHLYILGDLFDFWFEYRHAVTTMAPHVVFELYNLVRSGTAVTMFGGNHDFWLGTYLRDQVGVDIRQDGHVAIHQGRRMYLHHGDGLYPHDHGYRLLKRVLRNRVSIGLFSLIPTDIASWIARITSGTSRKYLAPPDYAGRNLRLFQGIGDRRLAEGFDAAVYGHGHVPLVERREHGILVLLGDWITHNTYVVLENGEFTLHSWPADATVLTPKSHACGPDMASPTGRTP